MTDKINELKALIETLTEDSPLRQQLQEALDAELNRNAKAAEEAKPAEEANAAEDKGSDAASEETDDDRGSPSGILDGLTEKLDELMNDDEFITAAAGFVLGAATIGVSALALSALKK